MGCFGLCYAGGQAEVPSSFSIYKSVNTSSSPKKLGQKYYKISTTPASLGGNFRRSDRTCASVACTGLVEVKLFIGLIFPVTVLLCSLGHAT